jgi:outer membrane protein assembly factor BamD
MRSVAALILSLLLLSLTGCGLLPEDTDETLAWSANKLYAEAKDAMNEGLYDKAVKYYEKLEARYPYGRYAQQAQLEVAYAYYKQYEPASSISACERFIRLHPNHPNIDYAYYLKGLVNFNEDASIFSAIGSQDLSERDPKSAREAFDTFKELITRFPESKYASDARQRMDFLVNSLAAHEVHVAAYYMRRGAYVAAVNRAQAAIKTYPGTPANEKALAILVQAYEALGIKDLRDDAERVLKKNFPNTRYLTGDQETKAAWWKLW